MVVSILENTTNSMLFTCSKRSGFFCPCRCWCRSWSVSSIHKEQLVRVLVVMDFIDTLSCKVSHCYRLIVVSHQRTCVTVRAYQDRQRLGSSCRDVLTETDVETTDIVPAIEGMIRQFQCHILCTHIHRHGRQGIVVHPAKSRKTERKSCKKLPPHSLPPFLHYPQ